MKKLLLASMLALICTATVRAQDKKDSRDLRRDNGPTTTTTTSRQGAVSATPEMWLYEQERSRYEDPKGAVRRQAEYRSTQRQMRLASSRWFGISNARPMASPVPYYGSYSPMWVGNTADPYQWNTVGSTAVIVEHDRWHY